MFRSFELHVPRYFPEINSWYKSSEETTCRHVDKTHVQPKKDVLLEQLILNDLTLPLTFVAIVSASRHNIATAK